MFMTVRREMVILMHCETVYIAKVWCLTLWRNGCSFCQPTRKSRVRIAQRHICVIVDYYVYTDIVIHVHDVRLYIKKC